MSIQQFLNLIGKKKQTIVSLIIVFLGVAIIFSAVQPFRYDSNLKLLTVLNFSQSVDPYTASRSNEYLSGLLARIVGSSSFFGDVKKAGFNIDESYFSGTEKQRLKKWNKTVKAKSVADTGIISIDVYHTDRAQAEEIANAVVYVLQNENAQYQGYGNNVTIKIIDGPITSDYPVEPNVLLNAGIALILSLFFSFCYIYLFPDEKYDIRLWPKKEKLKISNQFGEDEEPVLVCREPVLAPVMAKDEESEVEYQNHYNNSGYSADENNIKDYGSMDNIFKR
jgi:capsular polysaccharide biosynthesis protein